MGHLSGGSIPKCHNKSSWLPFRPRPAGGRFACVHDWVTVRCDRWCPGPRTGCEEVTIHWWHQQDSLPRSRCPRILRVRAVAGHRQPRSLAGRSRIAARRAFDQAVAAMSDPAAAAFGAGREGLSAVTGLANHRPLPNWHVRYQIRHARSREESAGLEDKAVCPSTAGPLCSLQTRCRKLKDPGTSGGRIPQIFPRICGLSAVSFDGYKFQHRYGQHGHSSGSLF
jgi:hypothetical protein